MDTIDPAPVPVRPMTLTCCCCGEFAGRFEQWPNRDTGYGCCRPCALRHFTDRMPGRPATNDLIGTEGVHWANAEQWAAMLAPPAP